MLELRKRHHDAMWHWSPQCSSWPESNFQKIFGTTCPDGAPCAECVRRAGNLQ